MKMITYDVIDLVSAYWEVWDLFFAHPNRVVVSTQVWHAYESHLIIDVSNPNYGSDHPQMVSHKAMSILFHHIVHASAVWEILTSQK